MKDHHRRSLPILPGVKRLEGITNEEGEEVPALQFTADSEGEVKKLLDWYSLTEEERDAEHARRMEELRQQSLLHEKIENMKSVIFGLGWGLLAAVVIVIGLLCNQK